MQWSTSLKIRSQGASRQVFDSVRRKWVALTPEELIRQLLICFFQEEIGFPVVRMSVERQFTVHGMLRRYDLVLFDIKANPVLLAECKAPSVSLKQDAMDQAARYNLGLRVPYLFVTNGPQAFCYKVDFKTQSWRALDRVPPLG